MNAHFLLKLSILTFAYVCYAANRHDFPLYPIYHEDEKLVAYVLKAEIGTPSKNYTLLMSTRSPISWIVGSKGSSLFWNKKAHGSRYVGMGKYELSSIVIPADNWRDEFSVKGINGEMMEIPNLKFGALSELYWTTWEDYINYDGIFGLADLHTEKLQNPLTESLSTINVLPTVGIIAPPPESQTLAMLTIGRLNDFACDLNSTLRMTEKATDFRFAYQTISFAGSVVGASGIAILDISSPYISLSHSFFHSVVENHYLEINQFPYIASTSLMHSLYLYSKNEQITNEYYIDSKYLYRRHNKKKPKLLYIYYDLFSLENIFLNCNGRTFQYTHHEMLIRETSANNNDIILGLPLFHSYCVHLSHTGQLITSPHKIC